MSQESASLKGKQVKNNKRLQLKVVQTFHTFDYQRADMQQLGGVCRAAEGGRNGSKSENASINR
ncbi:hypothetical protein EXN66_Car000896 [Channa argus]|uniref:Uncharacterized protein n=1 Tax=Channa argus TaxID=215402 RepID=A0A6G1QZG7_CHAAH|nr:hypothetical protein EXN66_Car000896 [Channa argus]